MNLITGRYGLILLSLLLVSISCESPNLNQSTLNLGTLQGTFPLPENQNCSVFKAYQRGEDTPFFEVSIDEDQIEENQYSFAHQLPEGEYPLKGILSCISEEEPTEHMSFYENVAIESAQETATQFRFFFDFETGTETSDVAFCADLMLQSLSPALKACVGEEIQTEYNLQWLRQDCGEVFLQLVINMNTYNGDPVTFPSENIHLENYVPEETGTYEIVILFASTDKEPMELYRSFLDIIECD